MQAQETKEKETLTAIDPFVMKFVMKQWNRPETIAKLIIMCDEYAEDWDGIHQIDRGAKGSLSGTQTLKQNIFENAMIEKYPVIKDLKKMCRQMVYDYFKANTNFQQPEYFKLEGWFNKLDGESTHPAHSHGKVDLVINLYLSCPVGEDRHGRKIQTRICFLAPLHLTNCQTYLNERSTAVIIPKVGEMIASPPMYIHYIPATHAKEGEWRRSISINVVKVVM